VAVCEAIFVEQTLMMFMSDVNVKRGLAVKAQIYILIH
jgi:hypothetical protein